MKKYLLFSVLFLLFFFSQINAQNLKISGKIIEKNNKEPLPSATVLLFSDNFNSPVKAVLCDTLGNFSLVGLKSGHYSLVSSFIGFISDTIENITLNSNKNIGLIELAASQVLLDEVSILAKKSVYQNHLDKKVYIVSQDIGAATSSASEILQNIPSVTVDIKGTISLRNTSNITYFINGKPSALLRRNAAAMLQQIPASSIEKIEIITNPSAKYRPDGIGGIINIVLKKKTTKGFSGQLNTNAGNQERYNSTLSLNYAHNNFKIYGNYGLRHSNGIILFTDNRISKDSINGNIVSYYNENGNSSTRALSHNALLGANYAINKYNSIEISGNYFLQNSFHQGFSTIQNLQPDFNPSYLFDNNSTNNEKEEEGEVNIALEHNFKNKEDHSITFEANFSAYDEREDKNFDQIYTVPENSMVNSNYLIQKNGNQQEINIDYALAISEELEFESGYAGEFIFDNIRYKPNNLKTQFLFNQQIHAFYALFSQSIEDFSFKAGIRAEQTTINSHLIIPLDSNISNDYFKLFPTLHLEYDLSENQQLSLSYSKRLNRPDPDELNPFPEYSDPRNAEAGNPNLKPEEIHSLEFGYQLNQDNFTLTSAIYYRYKYNSFTGIFKNLNDSVVLFQNTNLNTSQSGGLETVIAGHLNRLWTYNLTSDVYYTRIDASNLGYSSEKSSLSGQIKAFSVFTIFQNTSIQLNAYYNFPRITPQGSRKAFYYGNAGMKQNLFKRKASLTFTLTDVFHTYKINYSINSLTLDQKTLMQRSQPVIYIGFIWRFNNYKEENKLNFENKILVK